MRDLAGNRRDALVEAGLDALAREVVACRACPRLACIVALEGFAWSHVLRILADRGGRVPSPRPKFGHGAEVQLALPDGDTAAGGLITVLGSYHPSQQNTFTGRLTEEAFDRVWARARGVVGG